MEEFRVRCQSCGTVMYETTEFYNCHKPLTGDMLRLLPLYKDWPTYDGSLAVKSTSRFLMFCSNCGGYISTTGKLEFEDFPDKGISEERSRLADSHEFSEAIATVCFNAIRKTRCKIDEPIESLSDIAKQDPMTPEELSEKMDKRIGKTGSTPKRKSKLNKNQTNLNLNAISGVRVPRR